MTRTLASIRKIDALTPIYVSTEPLVEADSICQASVGGWRLVVKKTEFQVGDDCVFFEIDSILPEGAEWSEFMRTKKFRVKTMKLNKMFVKSITNDDRPIYLPVISQGLALPVSIIGTAVPVLNGNIEDVTEILGVTKYEEPERFVQGDAKGNFPSFIPKTDELRVQSYMSILDEMRGYPYYITVKLDGTSCTVYKFDENSEVEVASRNLIKKVSDVDTYYKTVLQSGLLEKMNTRPGFAIQGEICGEGIQKNKLNLKGTHFFAFNVYDIKAARYLDQIDFIKFCDELGVKTVPIIEDCEDGFDLQLEDLYRIATRTYDDTFNQIEGIVIRPKREQTSQILEGRMSFKFIHPEYLV